MRALLGGLGVDGFADVLLMLGAIEPADDAVATAIELRDGLRFVGPSDGFGADALAGVLVARMLGDDLPTGTDGYALADFVTEGAYHPSGLDHTLAVRIVACEQQFAEGDAGAPGPGPWAIAPGGSNLTRRHLGTGVDPGPGHRPAHRSRRRSRRGASACSATSPPPSTSSATARTVTASRR